MSSYVIQHGDLYWRPNGCGYTRNLIDAGIYSEVDAKRAEGCRRTPLDKAIPITPEMVAELDALVAMAEERLELFRATLPCSSCRRDVRGEFHLCHASEPPFTGLDDGPAIGGNRG